MLRLALRNAPSVSNLELALRNKFSAIDLILETPKSSDSNKNDRLQKIQETIQKEKSALAKTKYLKNSDKTSKLRTKLQLLAEEIKVPTQTPEVSEKEKLISEVLAGKDKIFIRKKLDSGDVAGSGPSVAVSPSTSVKTSSSSQSKQAQKSGSAFDISNFEFPDSAQQTADRHHHYEFLKVKFVGFIENFPSSDASILPNLAPLNIKFYQQVQVPVEIKKKGGKNKKNNAQKNQKLTHEPKLVERRLSIQMHQQPNLEDEMFGAISYSKLKSDHFNRTLKQSRLGMHNSNIFTFFGEFNEHGIFIAETVHLGNNSRIMENGSVNWQMLKMNQKHNYEEIAKELDHVENVIEINGKVLSLISDSSAEGESENSEPETENFKKYQILCKLNQPYLFEYSSRIDLEVGQDVRLKGSHLESLAVC